MTQCDGLIAFVFLCCVLLQFSNRSLAQRKRPDFFGIIWHHQSNPYPIIYYGFWRFSYGKRLSPIACEHPNDASDNKARIYACGLATLAEMESVDFLSWPPLDRLWVDQKHQNGVNVQFVVGKIHAKQWFVVVVCAERKCALIVTKSNRED